MGIKTTIDDRGVVQEAISGNDQVSIEVRRTKPARKSITAAAANVTISGPVTLVSASTVGVTASLPSLGASDLGKEYLILKNSGSNPLLVSGTNPITAGGEAQFEINTSRAFAVMAVSGSMDGFYWHVLYDTTLEN